MDSGKAGTTGTRVVNRGAETPSTPPSSQPIGAKVLKSKSSAAVVSKGGTPNGVSRRSNSNRSGASRSRQAITESERERRATLVDMSYTQFAVADDISGAGCPTGKGGGAGGAITCVSKWGVSFDDESEAEDEEQEDPPPPLEKQGDTQQDSNPKGLSSSQQNAMMPESREKKKGVDDAIKCDNKSRPRLVLLGHGATESKPSFNSNNHSTKKVDKKSINHRRSESGKRNHSDPLQYLQRASSSSSEVKKRSTFKTSGGGAEGTTRRGSCPSLGKKSPFVSAYPFLESPEGGLLLVKPTFGGVSIIQMTRSEAVLTSYQKELLSSDGDHFKLHSFIVSSSLPNIHIELGDSHHHPHTDNRTHDVNHPDERCGTQELNATHQMMGNDKAFGAAHPHTIQPTCGYNMTSASLESSQIPSEVMVAQSSSDGNSLLPENRISIANLAESLGLTPVTFTPCPPAPLVWEVVSSSGVVHSSTQHDNPIPTHLILDESALKNQRTHDHQSSSLFNASSISCNPTSVIRPTIPPKPQHLQQIRSVDSDVIPVPFRRRRRSDMKSCGSLDDGTSSHDLKPQSTDGDSIQSPDYPREYVIPAFR